MRTVLLTEAVDDVGMQMLRDRQNVELIVAPPDLLPALAKANAIGVRTYGLTKELLAKAVSLELVAKHGVGCDNIAVDYLSSRGIPVTITADANASSVAEHTMLLMLAAAKQLTAYDSAVRQGDWNFRKVGRSADLGGRTVLVVGLGRIGRRVAALCQAFGMRVLGHDVETAAVAARESGIEFMPDLASCSVAARDREPHQRAPDRRHASGHGSGELRAWRRRGRDGCHLCLEIRADRGRGFGRLRPGAAFGRQPTSEATERGAHSPFRFPDG